MTETFNAGVVDFNPRRMDEPQARQAGIPTRLQPYLADLRQYPLRIGERLQDIATWYDEGLVWYYASLFKNEDMVNRLLDKHVLILSGSGPSAFKFLANPNEFADLNKEALVRSQAVIKQFLGEGKWILGICFGGQLAVGTMGGILGRLPKNGFENTITEAGMLPHELT